MQFSAPTKITLRDFRRNLRVLEREVVTQLEGETRCCGVTLAQCHSLLELSQREHSLTALASALDLDASTLSRTVESMVKAGLCERTVVEGDRRSVRLALSALGRTKVDAINRTCDKYYADILGQLSASDRVQVIRSVGILADAMRKLRTSGKAQPSCCGGEQSVAKTAVDGAAAPPNPKQRRSAKKGPTP